MQHLSLPVYKDMFSTKNFFFKMPNISSILLSLFHTLVLPFLLSTLSTFSLLIHNISYFNATTVIGHTFFSAEIKTVVLRKETFITMAMTNGTKVQYYSVHHDEKLGLYSEVTPAHNAAVANALPMVRDALSK